jgi:hypothetical protein
MTANAVNDSSIARRCSPWRAAFVDVLWALLRARREFTLDKPALTAAA